MLSCISFDSYIKPQLPALPHQSWQVVYLLIPTSNHNFNNVYTWISLLYIFWFLHQTTTLCGETLRTQCCISFDSYIKPQLLPRKALPFSVVYLLIPTSNHNIQRTNEQGNSVVYLLIPTSNHNQQAKNLQSDAVVYLLIPTSNHNPPGGVIYVNAVVYLLIPTSNHNVGAIMHAMR